MDNFALYKSLFIDSFIAILFFILDYEYIIWVINLFGRMNQLSIVIITSFAYMFAIAFNYFFGLLCYKLFSSYFKNDIYIRYVKLKNFSKNYWFFILILSVFSGFGKFIFLFLGFLNINIIPVLFFGTTLKALYHIYYLTI